MKIKGLFISEKAQLKKWIYITLFLFIAGVTAGAGYSVLLSAESDSSVVKYLNAYFCKIAVECNYSEVLYNSLIEYTKLFIIIFLSSFVRPGIIVIEGTAVLKGIISGFTTASFIKYYGTKGIFASLSSLPSTVIYLPALLFFCAGSAVYCLNRYNREKKQTKRYIVLAICCLTTFCVASISDTYITTTFMKLISSFFVD